MVRRWVFLFLLTGLLAGLAPAPVTAIDTRTLVIESFHADIMVFRDGTLEVTETIRTRFTGQWKGIFRTIPIEYRTSQGFNYTLRLKLVSITDQGRFYTDALDALNKALKIHPEDSRTRLETARVYAMMKQVREARDHLAKAIASDPDARADVEKKESLKVLRPLLPSVAA